MNVYVSNILFAALSFPLIAFFITLPYMIYQYRRFGSIPWLRTLVVYSFAFYLLCAYFLVLLPLPEDRSAVVPYAQTPQLVPFNFVHGFLAETTFSPSDPSTWLAALRDPYVYEAFFNVLLLVPLGMYLRYYFRRTWWQTLAIGFLVTLSFETTQLTGLWGLYEHPYRLFDVDDLMLNTLGAMIGFWTVGPTTPTATTASPPAPGAGAGGATAAAEALGARAAVEAAGASWGTAVQVADAVSFAAFFALVPALTRGQTLAQKLLRLRIVRTDATPAHWYQYLARYGLLALFGWAPFALLFGVLDLDAAQVGEMNALAAFAAEHRAAVVGAWTAFMTAWAVSLAVRAVQAGARKRSFVMLNGVLSGTRVMTEAGVELARERRGVLDVDEVAALERAVAEDGTPLAELMDRAGRAVADEVRAWVPDPAPVVVLSGSGNNGGDGWVAARVLAEAGYPVTLVAPDLAERLHAEPARSTALETFARAAEDGLPLSVLIAPDADVLADAVDEAEAVVDALLGTGFSGGEVREPYAGWIRAANRRRFEGKRGKGRGRHRKRTHERGEHERPRRSLPAKAKDAPFAVAADVPSGLSAQTGAAARPTFAADATVTMLAYKPGLVASAGAPWVGAVKLAKLGVDASKYLEAEERA
ncbi:VanZ family protein [Eggerthella lenta]|nr:VanZ family protein [Eggerthella lenta]